MRLRVTEVLGFGELGMSKDRSTIVKHVEARLAEHFELEQSLHPRKQKDDRLYHVALLFLSSNGHTGFAQQELQLAKELQSLIHVVPIVPKADTFLPHEFSAMKEQIRELFVREGIQDFPAIIDLQDDEHILKDAQEIRSRFPLFTVAGKNETGKDEQSQLIRLRSYEWGSINLDSDDYNDMFGLRKLIVRSFLAFLRHATVAKIYEEYRREVLRKGQNMIPGKITPLINTPESIPSVTLTKQISSEDLLDSALHESADGEEKISKRKLRKNRKDAPGVAVEN